VKRFICASLTASLLTLPAIAQDLSSLQYAMANGISIDAELYGRPVHMSVAYHADGRSTTHITGAAARGADISGTWRVQGDQLCTVNIMNPTEACFKIPSAKKPGEPFTLTTPALGEVTVTINRQTDSPPGQLPAP